MEKSTYKQVADATTYRYHMRWQAISNNILREILIKNKADITNGIIKMILSNICKKTADVVFLCEIFEKCADINT